MSFEYKLWLSPRLYEALYHNMVETGDSSVKQTIKQNLLSASGDKDTVEAAVEYLKLRAHMKQRRSS